MAAPCFWWKKNLGGNEEKKIPSSLRCIFSSKKPALLGCPVGS